MSYSGSRLTKLFGGGNYFTEFLRPSKDWVIWDKRNPNLSFAEAELAWQSCGTNIRIYNIYSATQDKIHPTQKPIDLYKWLLKNYAEPEFKIIDTHLGSMSSVIAAYDFGVAEFIGAEIDEDYFNAGVQRFKVHQMQQKLF